MPTGPTIPQYQTLCDMSTFEAENRSHPACKTFSEALAHARETLALEASSAMNSQVIFNLKSDCV